MATINNTQESDNLVQLKLYVCNYCKTTSCYLRSVRRHHERFHKNLQLSINSEIRCLYSQEIHSDSPDTETGTGYIPSDGSKTYTTKNVFNRVLHVINNVLHDVQDGSFDKTIKSLVDIILFSREQFRSIRYIPKTKMYIIQIHEWEAINTNNFDNVLKHISNLVIRFAVMFVMYVDEYVQKKSDTLVSVYNTMKHALLHRREVEDSIFQHKDKIQDIIRSSSM